MKRTLFIIAALLAPWNICHGMLSTALTRVYARTAHQRRMSSESPALAFAHYPAAHTTKSRHRIPFRSLQAQNLKALKEILAANAALREKAENPIIIVGHKSIRNALCKLEKQNLPPFDKPEQPAIIVDHSEKINFYNMHRSSIIWDATRAWGKKLGLEITGFAGSFDTNDESYVLPISKGEFKKMKAYSLWAQTQPKSQWYQRFEKAMKENSNPPVKLSKEVTESFKIYLTYSKSLYEPKFKTIDVQGTIDLHIATGNNPDDTHQKAIAQLENGMLVIRTGINNL